MSQRVLAALAEFFAALATLVATVGLYGLLSFSAARRSKEMGIRRALGAPGFVAGALILREAVALVAVGLAIALNAQSWAAFQVTGGGEGGS